MRYFEFIVDGNKNKISVKKVQSQKYIFGKPINIYKKNSFKVNKQNILH